ncbi:MAG: hypothetical protein F9K31_10415, partial [Dokdonella sp.]
MSIEVLENLSRALDGVRSASSAATAATDALEALREDIARSQAQVAARAARVPEIRIDEALPIA